MLQAEIVEQAADAVIAIDLDERILYLNRAAEHRYGMERDEAIGKRLSELHTWRWLRPEDESEAALAIAEGRSWRGDNFHVTRDGHEIHVESIVSVLRDEDGEPIGLLATIRDVTEQRMMESALRDALAAKDAFLGMVSHELRTPMTVILGMGRLLAKGGLPDDKVRDLAADITESGQELDELIESMLLLARLDDRDAGRFHQPTLLHRVVEDVLRRQGERDPARPYRLEVRTTATLIFAEDTWIERLLLNLLGNASKYSEPGRPVTVTIEAGDLEVQVRVLDEGVELQGDELEHLFEPFYRGSTHRGRLPGAGLGLAVSKRITEALEGRIWVRARSRGGAEFGFALPLLLPDPEPGHEV